MDLALVVFGRQKHPIFGVYACVYQQILDEFGRTHSDLVRIKDDVFSRYRTALKSARLKEKVLISFDDSLKMADLEMNESAVKYYKDLCVNLDKEIQLLWEDYNLYYYCYHVSIYELKASKKRLKTVEGMSEAIRLAKWSDLKQGSLF